MQPVFFAGAALVISATAAHGANYHLVGQKPYGALFVDGSTVKTTTVGRQAWATLFLAKDGDGSTVTRGVAFLMTLDEYDCPGGRTRHLYLQAYNHQGEPVEQTSEEQPWQIVVPGSNADIEGRLICDDEFRRRDPAIRAGPLEMLRGVRASAKP